MDTQSIYLCNRLGLAEGCCLTTAHRGFSSLPHGSILLKMNSVILVKSNFKPKMDYEQFFPKQMEPQCERERFTIGVLAVLTLVYLLVDCMSIRNTNRKMNTLHTENETLKSIILKSMERSLLQMMHQEPDNEHED